MTPRRRRPAFLLVLSVFLSIGAYVGGTVNEAREATSGDEISESSIGKSNYTGEVPASDELRWGVGGTRDVGKTAAEVAVDSTNDEDEEEEAEEEETEYEDETSEAVDEYADELRAAAESHEAMSRRYENEGKNRSAGGEVQPRKLAEGKMVRDAVKKVFDSRESSVEAEVGSDESESSNEAILENGDEEVAELVRYKSPDPKSRPSGEELPKEGEKRKRVPTVKKELSTQKEIIKTSNASIRVEKRFSTKEMLDELNEQLKHSMEDYTEKPSVDPLKSVDDEISGEASELDDELESNLGEDYFAGDKLADSKSSDLDLFEDFEEPRRKLDKRQEAVLRDLEAYLRAEYAAEQEQQQKLQELGAQEGALAESLLELLVKLAENPRRWERVHRLLKDVEGGLELSREALEARKRAFNLTSSVSATTTTSSPSTTGPKKLRKKPKKKKKKKKQRHHRFSTPPSSIPTTIPLLTTTETPWLTTPMQWRLVAERLFGPPWPQDLQDDSGAAKVRFTVPSSSRTTSASREFGEQLGERKQLDDHKALNDERQALMLESSREYTQPRHLHYGKVSTHQGIVTSHRDLGASSSGFRNSNRDTSRVRDYDPPERRLYSQFYPLSRSRVKDEEYSPVVESYAQNREYRPPGREYAASKSWRDTQYNYGRPKWGWRESESEGKVWPQLESAKTGWHSPERAFWPRGQDSDEGKVWDDAWERVREPDPWSKGSWGLDVGKSNPPWETAAAAAVVSNEKVKEVVTGAAESPKITMKTWNSLTSDPATWPFKFTDTKPWPKDANGKSYNPNAALVRKLGLDAGEINHRTGGSKGPDSADGKTTGKMVNDPRKYKTAPIKTQTKEKSAFQEQTNPKKSPALEETIRSNPWRSDADTDPKIWPPKAAMSPKIQSVGAWVMPADQSTWKPYNLKTVDSYGSGAGADRWGVQVETNPRTWPPKIGDEQWKKFTKPLDGVAWPKWKQFAYHRVTATPILSPGPGSGIDGSRARNNAYIAVSAVSPKYNGNQWRKNDIEETPVVQSSSSAIQDSEHPVSQLRTAAQPAIYTWKKDGVNQQLKGNKNGTDPLEEQLETLRRSGSSWSHDKNREKIKEQLNIINNVTSEALASRLGSGSPRNSSSNKQQEVAEATASTEKGGYNPKAGIDQEKKASRS